LESGDIFDQLEGWVGYLIGWKVVIFLTSWKAGLVDRLESGDIFDQLEGWDS
jgi:hypothetical protein